MAHVSHAGILALFTEDLFSGHRRVNNSNCLIRSRFVQDIEMAHLPEGKVFKRCHVPTVPQMFFSQIPPLTCVSFTTGPTLSPLLKDVWEPKAQDT